MYAMHFNIFELTVSCCVLYLLLSIVMHSLLDHEKGTPPILVTPFGSCLQGIDQNMNEMLVTLFYFLSVYA